jgi:hypothetical protein
MWPFISRILCDYGQGVAFETSVKEQGPAFRDLLLAGVILFSPLNKNGRDRWRSKVVDAGAGGNEKRRCDEGGARAHKEMPKIIRTW